MLMKKDQEILHEKKKEGFIDQITNVSGKEKFYG